MQREKLEIILYRSRTGRMVFPEVIEKIAVDFMKTRLSDMVTDGMIEMCKDSYETECYDLITETVYRQDTYETLVHRMQRQVVLGGGVDCFNLIMLSCMQYGKFCKNRLKEWYSLPAENVMNAAGLSGAYAKWFARDAELFESIYGRTPSVREIFKIFNERHFKQLNMDIFINPGRELYVRYIPDKISEPFCRSRSELGLPEDKLDTDPQYAIRLSRLICVWTWYLVIVAPGRICFK